MFFRHLASAALILLLSVVSCERSAPVQQDQQAIQEISEGFVDAFNKKDAEKLITFWIQDAHYDNLSRQESISGKPALKDYFENLFQTRGNSALSLTINDINIEKSGKAIERGVATFIYPNQATEQNTFKAEYIRENGSWKLDRITLFGMQPVSSQISHLAEFDWLVGSWTDQDEKIDSSSTYSWSRNKNFLFQYFKMKLEGQDEIEGHQIIAWNPRTKNIHSWIFDSDGGFGESDWTKEGESWFSRVIFILPDGRVATALHVLKKIDPDTYTFASVSREIDGKILPDVGPFTNVRKK